MDEETKRESSVMRRIHLLSLASDVGPIVARAKDIASLTLVGSLAYAFGGLVNVAFGVVSARNMEPAAYAQFASVLTLIAIFTMPAGAVQLSTAKLVAEDQLSRGPLLRDRPLRAVLKVSLIAVIILAVVGLAFSQLSRTFSLVAYWLVPVFPIALASAWAMGRLQGLGRVKLMMTLGNTGSAIRLLWLMILITLGIVTVELLLLGVVVAGLSLLFVLIAASWGRGYLETSLENHVITGLLVVGVFVWASSQIDVVLAFQNFSGGTAGNYAAAAVIAKGIALVGTIFGTAYVRIYVRNVHTPNSRLRLILWVTIGSIALPGLILVATVTVLAGYLDFWMGPNYSETAKFLGFVGVATLPWAAAISLSQLAPLFSGRKSAFLCGLVFVVEVVLGVGLGKSPELLALVFGLSGLTMCCVLLVSSVALLNREKHDPPEPVERKFG